MLQNTQVSWVRGKVFTTQSTIARMSYVCTSYSFPASPKDDDKCLRYTQNTQWVYAKWGNLSLENPYDYKSNCKQICPVSL